jgi:hypothetical protein
VVDPVNNPPTAQTDADGCYTIPALIPGATYRIVDNVDWRKPGTKQIRKEFKAKPSQMLDLGDILIADPPPAENP